MSKLHQSPARHLAYPALSRPLTLLGCERRLFLGAATVGAAAFSSFDAPLAGLLLFACGYGAGLLMTRHDPALAAIVLRSSGTSRRYDPALRTDTDPGVAVVGGVSQ